MRAKGSRQHTCESLRWQGHIVKNRKLRSLHTQRVFVGHLLSFFRLPLSPPTVPFFSVNPFRLSFSILFWFFLCSLSRTPLRHEGVIEVVCIYHFPRLKRLFFFIALKRRDVARCGWPIPGFQPPDSELNCLGVLVLMPVSTSVSRQLTQSILRVTCTDSAADSRTPLPICNSHHLLPIHSISVPAPGRSTILDSEPIKYMTRSFHLRVHCSSRRVC